jgi:hypothetical protein
MSVKRPLKDLLASGGDESMDDLSPVMDDQVPDPGGANAPDGTCVECGDQPTDLVCEKCDEQFCQVCFDYLHRTGVC